MSDLTFYFDDIAKFYGSVFIKGWAHGAEKPILLSPKLRAPGLLAFSFKAIEDMPCLGDNATGFELQILRDQNVDPTDIEIEFDGGDRPIIWTWESIDKRISEHSPRS